MLRGFIAGLLGVSILDVVVSSQAAANRTGTLFTLIAGIVSHVISPTQPAIPDLRKRSTSGGSQAAADINPYAQVQANIQAVNAAYTSTAGTSAATAPLATTTPAPSTVGVTV